MPFRPRGGPSEMNHHDARRRKPRPWLASGQAWARMARECNQSSVAFPWCRSRAPQVLGTKMTNFKRLSIHRLLPLFSWTRQQHSQLPTRSFLQVEAMPPQKPFSSATELMLFKDESPHELCYTSLRDLLSTNRHAYVNVRESAREEIQEEDVRPAIKNRLVELAARAYLLPSKAQETPANEFFSRQWARFTSRSWLHSPDYSNLNLPSNVPCLPKPLWVDITRAFCSLFKLRHLRHQPTLRLEAHQARSGLS